MSAPASRPSSENRTIRHEGVIFHLKLNKSNKQ